MEVDIKAPKPWEVLLSRVLNVVIPFAKLANFAYIVLLLFASSIVWPKVVLAAFIGLALGFAHKNVQGVISQVVKNGNSEGGE